MHEGTRVVRPQLKDGRNEMLQAGGGGATTIAITNCSRCSLLSRWPLTSSWLLQSPFSSSCELPLLMNETVCMCVHLVVPFCLCLIYDN